MIARKGGGKTLFNDLPRLHHVLATIRSLWKGPLTVKCRLGNQTPEWKEIFSKRLALFSSIGIDALCVHPRFFHEKLKRRARWNSFSWIREHWNKPLIGNGDIVDEKALRLLDNGSCDALMVGRAAVTRPWIFQELSGNKIEVDHRKVWFDFYHHVLEDFTPERALGKIKEFTVYYSSNFMFGHELFRKVQPAGDLETLYQRADAFFSTNPKVMAC
jgi:tRNA-dihydrouridine synthase